MVLSKHKHQYEHRQEKRPADPLDHAVPAARQLVPQEWDESDVELLARYKQRYGVEQAIQKIYEYPLFQWEDVDGSQLKSRDFFKAPLELMKIRKRYKNKN